VNLKREKGQVTGKNLRNIRVIELCPASDAPDLFPPGV
jgi:hypothetical protein